MQWRADTMAHRRDFDCDWAGDARGVSFATMYFSDWRGADWAWHLADGKWRKKEKVNAAVQWIFYKKEHTKKDKKAILSYGKEWLLLLFSASDCACNLIGAHTSCANINRFDITVIFNDFYLLYIGFPFSICASAHLGTLDANSMTSNLVLLTNFTLRHLSAPPSNLLM